MHDWDPNPVGCNMSNILGHCLTPTTPTATIMGMDELWTARETANYLRCSTMTVYRLGKTGTLPCIRLGGLVRYRRADVEHLVKTGGAPPA